MEAKGEWNRGGAFEQLDIVAVLTTGDELKAAHAARTAETAAFIRGLALPSVG